MDKKVKCVFLDRDGVLNRDRGDYSYDLEHFEVMPGVAGALQTLRSAEWMLIVITNQAGISRGRYTVKEMNLCHEYLQERTDYAITEFYYSPYHPSVTRSLSRKPGTLMFERAIARYAVDVRKSWMIGDKERDLVPARRMSLNTLQVGEDPRSGYADHQVPDLASAVELILNTPEN